MYRHLVLRRQAISCAIAAAGFLAVLPAQAQTRGAAPSFAANTPVRPPAT